MLVATKEMVNALQFEFLSSGRMWPPPTEVDRLNRYAANKQLFENKHQVVFAESLKRIEKVIGNWENIVSFAVDINYFRKISLKTADLLFGESPQIKAANGDENEQKFIDQQIAKDEFINRCYMTAIDVSRYGAGIFYPFRDISGDVRIKSVAPSVWFPVFNADDVQETLCHIIAWDYPVFKNPGDTSSKADYFLKVQIHVPGKYIERLYKLSYKRVTMSNDGRLGIKADNNGFNQTYSVDVKAISQLISEAVHDTGLTEIPIIPVLNISTSDYMLGYDDYDDIQSIIGEIEVRIAQVAKILDQHAAPTMAVPMTACVQKDGKWTYKPSKAIPIHSKEDPIPQYITWNGQLDAAFQHIDLLFKQLYSLSEMGAVVWGDAEKLGNIPSGTALRRMMMSTLAKINRIRMKFDPAMKKALTIAAELKGVTLGEISTQWHDGLPTDDKESAEIIALRTGNKATMSRQTAIERFDGATKAAAETEINAIDEDEAMQNQLVPPVFNQGDSGGGM